MLRVGVVVFLVVTSVAPAAEPFRFPEAKHGKGELRYVQGIPILTVAGTPEEMGEQVGTLAVRPVKDMEPEFKAFLKRQGLDRAFPLIVKACNTLISRLPEDHRKELDAMAKASGMDRDMFVVANTILDILKIGGCSTLIVEPVRSGTGELLLGRNFDFWSLDALSQYHLVTVYRPKGKKAFVTIGFPGLIGFPTAMNEDGLCLAVNEIPSAADKSPRFDPEGLPSLVTLRRIMEECSTIEEAEKLVRGMKRATLLAATVCDPKTGAVLEITTRNVIARRPEAGLGVCTNHFCTKELATDTDCARFTALLKSKENGKLTVDDVAKLMHSANQGKATLHTIVFEPKARRLHVALGDGKSPASGKKLERIDFGPYLQRSAASGKNEEKPPVTDEEVAKFVYDQKYKVPADFVKDHALADVNKSLYFHQPGWFADDKAKAKQIVQDFLDKPSNIEVRKIQEEKETPRSFDFRGGSIWYRIHKPGYFSWKGKRVGDVEFPQPPDGRAVEVGQFKLKPLTMQAVKEYAEYEWLIQFYNLNGAKVLKSEAKELKDTIVVTLWTTGVVYGDFGLSDEITLSQAVWTVQKADGMATKSLKVVKMTTGKKN